MEMAEGCDVIITGIGDCGSCSASAVADGIAFEASNLPAAAICSDAFGVTADAMAELRGVPGSRYATTPHPVAADARYPRPGTRHTPDAIDLTYSSPSEQER